MGACTKTGGSTVVRILQANQYTITIWSARPVSNANYEATQFIYEAHQVPGFIGSQGPNQLDYATCYHHYFRSCASFGFGHAISIIFGQPSAQTLIHDP